MLDRNSVAPLADLSEAVGTGQFYRAAARPCGRPLLDAGAATSYNLSLPRSREAVVVVQRLNRTAARAYVFPCTQTIVPVSTSLLLGLR